MYRLNQLKLAAIALLLTLLVPASGFAFCGFYVGGAGASMFNDATQVVLMREGTKTILSMQNRYNGPPTGFAMVVPVPVVLQQDDVKTLSPDIFDKVDTLTSPRLVEYWEQDPCQQDYYDDEFASPTSAGNDGSLNNGQDPGTVTVEAQFAVGEYNISVLSATDSGALDTWLDQNNYNVPDGAGPYYQPYINAGMYFFVAQVDPTKVNFDSAGNTVLSPLRFNYDTPEFELPVRLGMINSAGQQDLMVYVLAPDQRYELANYPNAFIPTNVEVVDSVRNDFGSFYKALFARTLKENPKAAITEYSWNASSCDPCPGPVTLQPEDLATLGADLLGTADGGFNSRGFVITRLHLRYDKDEVGEDLVFRKADPVVGGRERHDENGVLETGATPASINNFQARYIIRHRWEKPILCADPVYGRWGGDPDSSDPWNTPVSSATSPNTTGGDVFEDSSPGVIEDLVREDIPEINVEASERYKGETGCSSTNSEGAIPAVFLILIGFVGIGVNRRRRRS